MKKLICIAGIIVLVVPACYLASWDSFPNEHEYTPHNKPLIEKRCFRQHTTDTSFIKHILYYYIYYNNNIIYISLLRKYYVSNKYIIIFKYVCRPHIGYNGRHVTEAIIWRRK